MTHVQVPADRVERWVANFEARHGTTTLGVAGGALRGVAEDGSTFAARLPFETAYDGPAAPAAFAASVTAPADWGVLLVRKGGFAIARLTGQRLTDSKVGQRHVQGRTKAGGQSQQRFARRRDNQARQAYEAAADHAARILGGMGGPGGAPGPPPPGGGGGGGPPPTAVEEVLADPRLRGLPVSEPWLAVPDPRRAVLEEAIREACSVGVDVVNA